MKVINSLFLFAPCLSALVISCCEYFLISVKLRRVDYLVTDLELFPLDGVDRPLQFVLNASVKQCPYGDNKKNLCDLFQKKHPQNIEEFSFREIMLNIGNDLFLAKKERGL